MKKYLSLLGAAILIPQLAWAHAHLKQSTPEAGSTVTTPARIIAAFSEGLEPVFSTMAVSGEDGKSLDLGKATIDPGDDKTLVLPIAHALAPGVYSVAWRALSKDGHKTQGTWTFTVKP